MADQHISDDRTVGTLGVWRLCCDEAHEPCSDEACTCEMCTEWRFIRAEARMDERAAVCDWLRRICAARGTSRACLTFDEIADGIEESEHIAGDTPSMADLLADARAEGAREALEKAEPDRPHQGQPFRGQTPVPSCVLKRSCPVCHAVRGALCFNPESGHPWATTAHCARSRPTKETDR